jgi:hypothetical protein
MSEGLPSSRRATDLGFEFTLVTSNGERFELSENAPVTLPCGAVFVIEVTTKVKGNVAKICDYRYNGSSSTVSMCTVSQGRKTLEIRGSRRCLSGWTQYCTATFTIIGQPPVVVANDEDKDTTKTNGSSFDLFVETCDDDPVCYPVVDGRVEVPAGTIFRFVATTTLSKHTASVKEFHYQPDNYIHSAWVTNAVLSKETRRAIVPIECFRTVGACPEWVGRANIDVTVVPILNDRSAAAAPVADVQFQTPLGEKVEREHCASSSVFGKRFVPPWDKTQRACEGCFMNKVADPQGWTAINGDDACNYKDVHVTLENATGEDAPPLAMNDQGDYVVSYGTVLVPKTSRGEVSRIVVQGGCFRVKPIVFEPTSDSDRWKITVYVDLPYAERTYKKKFRVVPAETEEELARILRAKSFRRAIDETTGTLNELRESLERTLEKIRVTQDKLTELKVEEAKIGK